MICDMWLYKYKLNFFFFDLILYVLNASEESKADCAWIWQSLSLTFHV